MAIVDVIEMKQGEVLTRAHDWSDQLPSSTVLSSAGVTVTDLETLGDVSGTLIHAGPVTSVDNITTVSFNSPTEGKAYRVRFSMTRNDDELRIDDYLLRVGEATLTTVYDLIADAWDILGLTQAEQVVPPQAQNEFLRALNVMLKSWSAKRTLVPSVAREFFTLVPGINSYTIGTGGTFNTDRPKEVLSAFLRKDNRDYPVEIVTRQRYDAIYDKNMSRRPCALYYEPGFPLGRVYLDSAPDNADFLFLKSFKEMTTYANVLTLAGLEGDYEEAIKYNLAVRKASAHGVTVTSDIAAMAGESLRMIRTLRQRNASVATLKLDVTALEGQNYGYEYDILTGQ